MTRRAAPRLHWYAVLGAAALLLALVLGRPELVALGAPFAVLAVLAVALAREPELRVGFGLARDRVLEGDEVEAELELAAGRAVARLDVALPLSAPLAASEGARPQALALAAGQARTLPLRLACPRWGAFTPGEVVLRAYDAFGLVVHETRVDCRVPLRVYPRIESLRALVPPLRTQVRIGNEVARVKGEGIEFADLRPFVHGDRVRRINWRASARRQVLTVTQSHPERNADVVLFLDVFADLRREGRGTLDLAVRAAAALAAGYLERRDRVGVVSFGTEVTWLTPAMGDRHLYRIVETLLETHVVHSHRRQATDVLPPRSLPAGALVVALSPLSDLRAIDALLDLRARGFDLVVVELSSLPFVEPGPSEVSSLAFRVWRLSLEAVRFRFERLGVPVAEWTADEPLGAALEEVIAFRRHARIARA